MIIIEFQGQELIFKTGDTLFSPNGLDKGTRAMLSQVAFAKEDKVLDLGCGYGVVGIYAAKFVGEENVTMTDIDEAAVAAARENVRLNGFSRIRVIQSDGFAQIDDTGYMLILSNPPYHTDFSVAKHFIEKGFNRLVLGGRLLMVTKRLDWYKNKLIAIFGGVKVQEIDSYFVFTAEKRSMNYANAKKQKQPKTVKQKR